MKQIKNLFNIGSILKQGSQLIQFRVYSVKDIKVIIDHFDKYPLITDKNSDFQLFKQAYQLMEQKEHLNLDGLHKIIAIKASMNRGLSDEFKLAFPDVIPVIRPGWENQKVKDFH